MFLNKETDMTSPSAPILVIGGTGKTGRRVANRLAEKGLPVRIGSRSASPAFDWQRPESWDASLDGVRAAYITYYPDIALPGAVEQIDAFITKALAHGVERLVLLTGRGEPEAQRAEQVLAQSGADWTVVRASWFAQNFSENFFIEGLQAGEVVFPRGDIPEPFVDVEDIADVVTAALTQDGHAGEIYEVTGPRLLTFRNAISEIAAASGRNIRYVSPPVEAFMDEMSRQQMPADIVELLGLLTREVLDGRNAYLADGVQRALGRAPRDFSDYVRATAATGVWKAAA